MTETTPQPEISNAFTRLLQEFHQGKILGELSDSMRKCVQAARESGKPAELKYTLKFAPNGDAIVVSDKLETKLPKEDRKAGLFFATEENTLTRDNPEQRTFELHTVDKKAAETVDVTRAKAAVV